MSRTKLEVKLWIFKSTKELNERREAANLKFIKEYSKGMSEDSIKEFFLTTEEERDVFKRYESILHNFCLKFQPPMPKNVVRNSLQYFKRFYLNNSVMDYHPKYIVFSCAYLASKVEKFNVDISQFLAHMIGDREKAIEIFLNRVLFLMRQITFDLFVLHPYQFIERFLIDIKTRYTKISDPERLRPEIEEFLDKIQFTDAYFLYSRSEIALAAVAYGTTKLEESIDGYLNGILFKNEPEKLVCAVTAIKTMVLMLKYEALQIFTPVRANLEEKLDKCQNKKNNPSSAACKRKLEEQDEVKT
ncbi:cyclin-H [Trichonephila clavata]|uniref:Cyclin-H n=1 Tax=Trichonephila clavata TaxID=2740835 RepID=A0A8X6G6V5_TRICU|nr:cyclin-H [Trichonephila clavata]